MSAQVRNIDIAPTLLDVAGLPIPPSFEGESLLPLLEQPSTASDRIGYASLHDRFYPDAVLEDSVSDGAWTYIRRRDDPGDELLFDRRVDPQEKVNLIGLDPQQADRMRALLDGYLARAPDRGSVDAQVRIDPRLAEKLRALGYAGR